MKSIVVVGASLAGLRSTEALRREGYEGAIHLIGDEPHRPYDRPPLSKQILSGEWEPDRAWLVDADKLADLNVETHFAIAATGLDVAATTVTLNSGASLDADGVIIATGARARSIGEPKGGLFTVRTLDDSIGLRAALAGGPSRVVVIGAGFIGAEVAATARGLGIDVTMVEMAAAPFERSLGAEMGAVLADIHRDEGVDLRLGVGCAEITGGDQVTGVVLTDGTVVEAEVVVVGVGVIPNTEWLADSGLDLGNGVRCDETSLAAPGVVAAGDVAEWPNPRFGGDLMRVEHWDNATTHGVHAARRLVHGESAGAYEPTPWFWSDQYDAKIQLAGRTTGFDRFAIVAGDPAERKFAGIYGRDDKIIAVVGFNRPRHVMRYRGLIDSATDWQTALAAEF